MAGALQGDRHAHCAEHVPLAGYTEPICILKGQDRTEAIAFAEELLLIARRIARRPARRQQKKGEHDA